MASELKKLAAEFVKSLGALDKAMNAYFNAALAEGRATGDATACGLDARQLRRRIHTEVVARLSPRPVHGMPEPVLQLEGAPQARRFVAANPLPGLS